MDPKHLVLEGPFCGCWRNAEHPADGLRANELGIVANHTNEQSLQWNQIFGATNKVTLNNKITQEKSQELLLTLALSR